MKNITEILAQHSTFPTFEYSQMLMIVGLCSFGIACIFSMYIVYGTIRKLLCALIGVIALTVGLGQLIDLGSKKDYLLQAVESTLSTKGAKRQHRIIEETPEGAKIAVSTKDSTIIVWIEEPGWSELKQNIK